MERGDGNSAGNVVSLDAARKRRAFVALAQDDGDWLQIKASMALSGLTLTDDDAERCGRILAGVITYEQACAEINALLGLDRASGSST